MRLAAKAAQLCHLLDLQSFIAQQIFGLFQPGVEEVIFWRGGEEAAVVDVELAFLQVHPSAEAFYVPVLFAFREHFQAQALEQGIEMPGLLFLRRLLGQTTADGDKQQGHQGVDGLVPVGEAGEVFLLQAGNQGIDLHGVFWVEHRIFRHGKAAGGILIGRKVKIAVAELLDGLIVLGGTLGVEDAGIFLCDYYLVFHIDFHGGLELEEKIIPAPSRAENRVVVVIGPVIFTEIQLIHGMLLILCPGKP